MFLGLVTLAAAVGLSGAGEKTKPLPPEVLNALACISEDDKNDWGGGLPKVFRVRAATRQMSGMRWQPVPIRRAGADITSERGILFVLYENTRATMVEVGVDKQGVVGVTATRAILKRVHGKWVRVEGSGGDYVAREDARLMNQLETFEPGIVPRTELPRNPRCQ